MCISWKLLNKIAGGRTYICLGKSVKRGSCKFTLALEAHIYRFFSLPCVLMKMVATLTMQQAKGNSYIAYSCECTYKPQTCMHLTTHATFSNTTGSSYQKELCILQGDTNAIQPKKIPFIITTYAQDVYFNVIKFKLTYALI